MKRYTKKDRKEILSLFLEYVESTEIPQITEFCYRYKIHRRRLYDWEEFSDALELFRCKKQSAIVSGVLAGNLNTPMGIFMLKQMGWRDKPELEKGDEFITGGIEFVPITQQTVKDIKAGRHKPKFYETDLKHQSVKVPVGE